MITKKIRRRIISETKQVAVLVNSAAESDILCEFCGSESAMISPLLAAKLSRTSTREVYRLIENGEVHFVETPDSQVFVCTVSFFNRV